MKPPLNMGQLITIASTIGALSAVALFTNYRIQRSTPESGAWKRMQARTEKTVVDWASLPNSLAMLMMERYGPPNRISKIAVVWTGRPP